MTHTMTELMMAMSDVRLRLETAKEIGWEFENQIWYDEEGVEGTKVTDPDGFEYFWYGWNENIEVDDDIMPDWPTDIRAAYEIEESIPEELREKYSHILWELLVKEKPLVEDVTWFDAAHAPARIRCIAYIMTVEGMSEHQPN